MAAPVDAQINVVIDTSQANAQLRALQSSINTINKSMAVAGSTAVAQQARLNKNLLDSAKASGMWEARVVPMTTAMNQFSDSLDRGKMTLGEYTRYATSAMPGMSRVFRREFDMMTRVAEDRVKRMQTQFVNLGNSANGVGQALALTPRALDQYASSAAVATQRQVMMNRMIDLGSTKLLNWGKNTQWAGRQLMVGFSIPLAMMGAAAAKAFKEIDQSSIAFRRVYGDLQTTTAEMENNLEAVKALGMEYTKYGQSLAETIDLAAKVAATGAENETLMAATEQTIRLATLGMMEYNEAMDATIALQTAFQVSNEDLAQTIDFLNVVENQTVLSMQDMAAAIPRVAPVVRGLGGDVKDLAVFMTAMREGGISAEQGANALKSGLGRLINPTKAAKEMLAEFGININSILQTNKGDLMGLVKDFGDALSTLGEFEQQQVLQKVFGTYQYARLGALFKNISNDAGQAQRTMELTAMSVEDLAKISERELGRIEEATSVKFAAALERLKVAIAPLGEMFMKVLMPIIDRVAKVADAFNNLPEGIKNAIGVAVAAIGGLAPILIMITGLFGNAIANSIKFVQFMRKGFARIKGNAAAFDNLTMQELEAKAAADALSGSTDILTGKFLGQQRALIGLNGLLERYRAGLMSIPGAIPGAGRAAGGTKPGTAPLPFARGGIVPGTGNKDSVPAMLTPGESVITKQATRQYAPILQAMNAGSLPGFAIGRIGLPRAVPSPIDSPYKAPQSVKKIASQQPEYANMPANTAKLIAGLKLRGKIPENVLASMLRTDVSHRFEDVRGGRKFWDQRNLFNAPGAENLGFQNMTSNKAYMNILRFIAGGDRRFNTIFSRKKHPTSASELTYSASLIKRAQTYINNNPNDPDVIAFKNTKTYENSWDIIAGAIFSARASKNNKDFPLAAPLYGKSFVRPKKMAQGGVVPGQGNRDTIPALLTPGESVITKEATSKFGPILEAMNRGTVRGFAEAEVGIDAPQTMRGSGAHYTRPKIVRDTEEIRKIIENNIEQAQLVGRSTKEFQTALDELNAGARMQATLFTNAISNIPEIANMDEMTGTEFGRMLSDQGNREKMMKPFIEQFAKELGTDAATLRSNPDFIRSVNSIAEEVGTTLAQRGGEFVNTSEFNDAFNTAIDKKIASGEFGPAEAEAARNLRTRKTRVSILADGKEIVSRAPIYGAGVTAYGRGAQEGFGTEFLTEEGNAKRRARAEARAARRLAYEQSQRAGATARGAAIRVASRSDIRQLLEESGLGPAARATQRAESERAATEKARQREIRRQEIISGRRLTQLLGPRVTPQAGPQSNRIVDLGMPVVPQRAVGGGADAKEELTRRQKMSQMFGKVQNAGMMAGFGLMGLATAATFAGGTIGDIAMKILPVAGVLSTLPMLMNPIGLTIAAVGGLTAATIMAQKHIQNLARDAAQAGANIGGVADSLKIIEEATGFVPPTVEDRLFRFSEEDKAAISEFSSFFEGERGSKFVKDLKEATSEERYEKVAYILAQGIASGLDPEKAKMFGFAIAEATGDSLLKGNIARDFANNAFGYGADKLIELEKQRMKNAPKMQRSGIVVPGQTNIYGGVTGANRGFRAPAFLEGITAFLSDIGLTSKDTTEALKQTYTSLGFASQQILNLSNAEAVLQDQRAKGLISLNEYKKQEEEINILRDQTVSQMGDIFKALGTAAPDIRAGFESQLQLAGFDEGQITGLLDQIAPEDLAQQIFSQSYLALSEAQQNYIDEVFARTISGITPENVEQRLQDVETIYKDIAFKVTSGIFTSLEEGAQVAGLEQWLKSTGLGENAPNQMVAGRQRQQFAQNLFGEEAYFQRIGTSLSEVQGRLNEISNMDTLANILGDPQEIQRFARFATKLAEFEDINIELAFEMETDPDSIIRSINEIKNMRLDPKIFGNAAIDADKIVNAFMEMGVEAGLVPGKLEKGVAAIEKFGKEAITKLGTIKPKIMPQIIADVFGTNATTSGQISDALNAAFPSQLSPIDLAIVLSLAGDKNALALLTNPQAIAAARRGEQTLITTERKGQDSFTRQFNLSPLGALGLTGETPGAGMGAGEEKGGGGGGKSWWQQQLADLKANAKLYGNGANSVIQQLKDLNIPDQLIQAMGTGEEGLKNAQEILRMAEKQPAKFAAEMKRAQKVIGQEALINLGFEPTEEQIRNVKLSLEERKVEKNIIDEIVNSQEYLNIMLYGGVGLQKQLVDELRKRQTTEDMINATVAEINKEHEKAIGILDEQINKQQGIVDGIQEEIDALQKKNEDIQWSIRGKEREKEIIDRQIEKLEYANEMDQRRIQTLQRQDELRNRDADAISRELEAMSDLENKIRDSYQQRIDALDKVAQVNQNIINQQKQQLGLSQAISQGDIYAATAAAQEMRASQAEFAQQQVRSGLEQGMENAVSGLVTSEGLTREQAEARIKQIKEQSYQTSLLIRDIEDVIYQRNQEIIPLKDQQYQIDLAIRDLSDQIFNNESEIYRITNERLLPEQQRLANLEDEKQLRIDVTEEAIKAAEALDDQNLEAKDLAGKLKTIADGWSEINGQISEANRLYRDTMATLEKEKPNPAMFETAKEYSAAKDKYDADIAAAKARREASVNAARATGNAQMRAILAGGNTTSARTYSTEEAYAMGAVGGGGGLRRFSGGMINYKGSNEPPPAQMMGGGRVKKYPMGGLIPYADGGKVFGRGGMDSVNAMLTPGEFVVRRAMVDKYGIPMLNALNQGAFGMPRYNVDQTTAGNVSVKTQNTSNIVAPMYNNYSVNVSVSNTNASADEIANRTIMKIKQIQDTQIRSNRGY